VRAKLVGQYQARKRSWARPAPVGFITVSSDSKLVLLDFQLSEIATYPTAPKSSSVHSISPDLKFAAVLHEDRVALIDQSGVEQWSLPHAPWGGNGSESGCSSFSVDGANVWVVVPDSPIDASVPLERFPFSTDGSDQLWVIDVESGRCLFKAQLSCNSAGGEMVTHSDGEWIGIGIGEGQDGSLVYWACISNSGRLEVQQLADTSRILIDVHASGATFLTTPQERDVVQVHAFPSGDVLAELVNDFNDDEFFDFDACYIDAQYALVKVTNGEDGSQRFEVVDATTLAMLGTLQGPLGQAEGMPEVSLVGGLGDGTWLTISWPDSLICRWTLDQGTS
jgi:hypothetical protein